MNQEQLSTHYTKQGLVSKLFRTDVVDQIAQPCTRREVGGAGHVLVGHAAVAEDIATELVKRIVHELL